MSHDFRPGEVAMVTWEEPSGRSTLESTEIALRSDCFWEWADGSIDDRYVTSVRPLVVIDPDAIVHEGQADDDSNRIPEIINCLRRIAEADSAGQTWRALLCMRLADEVERQHKPPKPEEPTGLGAVVEDASRVLWIKIDGHSGCNDWIRMGDTDRKGARTMYSKIDAAKVLSEGVTS